VRLTSFRHGIPPRHKAKPHGAGQAGNCVFDPAVSEWQICGAAGLKSDIHWRLSAARLAKA
jgi:hypothetical protein